MPPYRQQRVSALSRRPSTYSQTRFSRPEDSTVTWRLRPTDGVNSHTSESSGVLTQVTTIVDLTEKSTLSECVNALGIPYSDTFLDMLEEIKRNRQVIKSTDGESIWPISLDAAMLLGERYVTSAVFPRTSNRMLALVEYALETSTSKQPRPKRSTPRGRQPRRNVFVSQFILITTGRRRRAMQVGSRLQTMKKSVHNAPCEFS